MATKWDKDFDHGFHGQGNKPKNYKGTSGKRPTLAKGKKKTKPGAALPTIKDLDKAAKDTYMYPSWSNKSPYS